MVRDRWADPEFGESLLTLVDGPLAADPQATRGSTFAA